MIYTASEIINLARELSQTSNSRAFSFSLLVHLLNNAYSSLYNDLSVSNAFTGEFEFSGLESDLPPDCFKITEVVKRHTRLNRSSNGYLIPGCYTIENNSIKVKEPGFYSVKYIRLPEVLTASDNIKYLGKTVDSIFAPFLSYNPVLDEYHVFYYDGTSYHDFNIDTLEDTILEDVPVRPVRTFRNKPVTVESDKVKVGEDEIPLDSSLTNKVVWDNEHLVVSSYDNNSSKITVYDVNLDNYDYNPVLKNGRYPDFIAMDISTNDETGKYILLVDREGRLCINTYTPDTVLEYPINTFFDVLIDRLAIEMASLCGIANNNLEQKLQRDEMMFYASINASVQGIRVKRS